MGGFCSSITGPKPFRGQKYQKIRKHYIKLGHNIYFKDLKFSASDAILTVGQDIPRNIEWKRPNELGDDPSLLVGLLGQNSVKAGLLSQPWIVCAFSLLAARTELWHWVVPQYRTQCWGEKPESHPGIFHFRLWWRGEWVDVVIDDLLPVLNGEFIGARSTCASEWWPALLEKAYAKLLGSYAALKSVELSDVLVDLTGGVSEQWTLPLPGEAEETFWQLFQRLKNEIMRQSLVIAWVRSQNLEMEEGSSDRTALGLELGQPYLVLATKKVCLESSTLKGLLKGREKVAMVRLCNPCQATQKSLNQDTEANCKTENDAAAAGEDSAFVFTHKHLSRMLSKVPEWSRLSEAERQKMGLTVDDDREFWVPLEDFIGQFSQLCVCRLLSGTGAPPLACGGTGDSHHWTESSVKGQWPAVKASTQGLLQNPQFLIDVPAKGADIVIQLMQWSQVIVREDLDYPAIGFTILKVEENRKYRLHTMLGHCPSVLSVGEVRRREANGHTHLGRGRYLVMPHTEWEQSSPHVPSRYAQFLLRCFSSSRSKLRAVTLNSPPRRWWKLCFTHNFECVTVVTVKAAEGLRHQSNVFGCDSFCEIRCEGTKIRTPVVHDSVDPTWDRSFVFYRRHASEPLTARVLRHRTLLPNVLIGQALLPAPVNHQPSLVRAELQLPGFEDGSSQGVLVLEVTTEDDLSAI